jgi:hypothetical protein
MESLDFLGDVNPTIKLVVYVLILVHLAAVGFWCVVACPGMFKSSDSFSDRVEKAFQENKAKKQ